MSLRVPSTRCNFFLQKECGVDDKLQHSCEAIRQEQENVSLKARKEEILTQEGGVQVLNYRPLASGQPQAV